MGKIHIYIFAQVYYLESLASETTSEQKSMHALYFVWDISELWYFTHHLGHLFLFQLDYKLYDTTMVFWEYQNTRIMYAVRKCLVYLNAHTLV